MDHLVMDFVFLEINMIQHNLGYGGS